MFDIHQSVFDENGAYDSDRQHDYVEGLMGAFADSPEAQPIIECDGSVGYAAMMLDYYFGYIGGKLADMSVRDFSEVVFELFPRKVSTPPESAPAILAELKAFWTFVQRQYGLKIAAPILAKMNGAESRLRDALANPRNWCMAKSIFMSGTQAGYDMTTQEGMAAFTLAYNSSLQQRPLAILPPMMGRSASSLGRPTREKGERDKKRQEHKRQRQARKRARK